MEEEANRSTFQTSEHLDQIFTAMAKCQGEMEPAVKDSDNPFFKSKYADLAAVWEAIRPHASKYGLCCNQFASTTPKSARITTIIGHTSGQWMRDTCEIWPVKTDPQSMVAASTYARRMGMQAAWCCPAEDDDGNTASGKEGPIVTPHADTIMPNTEIKGALVKFTAMGEKGSKLHYFDFQTEEGPTITCATKWLPKNVDTPEAVRAVRGHDVLFSFEKKGQTNYLKTLTPLAQVLPTPEQEAQWAKEEASYNLEPPVGAL